MITFEEATSIISSQPATGLTEHIDFTESVGRVISEGVFSDIDMPPFNKSAMDGYACRRADLPGPLLVLEEIPAGRMPSQPLSEGACSVIMTGAPLPEGSDCVIMVEHTSVDSEDRVTFTGSATRDNICFRGEDARVGQLLIESGTLIRPEHIAIMASAGATRVAVSREPRIVVFTTGDELVEPHITPTGSAIRNSNGYQITAQLQQSRFNAIYGGIIPDTADATSKAINAGFLEHDLVILTGGVSQGSYDYVPQVMEGCGVRILFHHLAVQPGKPALLGKRDDGKYLFGLPGNPVSCFVQTELLVKMLCYRLKGHDYRQKEIRLPLGIGYHRKRTERKAFVPVRIDGAKLFPVLYHGSANIQALHGADGFMVIEQGIQQLNEGDLADVRLF
jgi:molybdopterin molybdotransferase